jgi:hypothetical protein
MRGRTGAAARLAVAGSLILPLVSAIPRALAAGPPGAPPAAGGASTPRRTPTGAPASPSSAPRGYLIHLIDGSDPIVVKRYVEEGDEIRFEKFGGWIGIPRYEVLKIVPDVPDEPTTAAALPAAAPEPAPDGTLPGVAGRDRLIVTTRDGASVRAQAVTADGNRLRVTVPDGSFTLARSDVIGIVRIPPSPGRPEAWLTVLVNGAADTALDGDTRPDAAAPISGGGSPKTNEDGASPSAAPVPSAGATPTAAPPVLTRSAEPHLLRLVNGQVLRVDGFWIEGNEIRFERMGGMVGMALSEVARLIPEELASVAGRTAVRYGSQLGPDLLEVRVRSGVQRVRLIGIEPVPDVHTADDPWQTLSPGIVVYLEFDRQRYDSAGDWLAYLFLPSGRMLNTELIRSGLARPRPDGRNLRYLDLLQKIGAAPRLGADGAPMP